jgi:eukaryotic-like serine/threonine-protein kinase
MKQETMEGNVRWSSQIGHDLIIAPAVTSDLVLAAGLAQSKQWAVGYLHALDRVTGQTRWTFSGNDGGGLIRGILATPVVAEDRVYFGVGDGAVYCLDLHSGTKQWEQQVDGAVVAMPTLINEQILIASQGGSLSALDRKTGRTEWTFRAGGGIWTQPLITAGVVIITSWDGKLYAVDAKGGLVWTKDLSPPVRPIALVAANEQFVFFDSASGAMRAVEIKQQSNVWQVEDKWRLLVSQRTGISPVLANNLVCFVEASKNQLVCVDADSGATRWQVATGNSPLTPQLDGTHLIVAGRDGRISSFDLGSGTELWRIETGIMLNSDPSVLDGVMYVGGSDRSLYALALQTA